MIRKIILSFIVYIVAFPSFIYAQTIEQAKIEYERAVKNNEENAYENYLVKAYYAVGDTEIFKYTYGQIISNAEPLIQAYFKKSISKNEFLKKLPENISTAYFTRLNSLGLTKITFDDSWKVRISELQKNTLNKFNVTTVITDEQILNTCPTISGDFKTFVNAVHKEQGLPLI